MTSLFSSVLYLNKKNHHFFSRIVIIVITNIGVLAFSIFLGFKSGVFFYLFNATHLILLLFNNKQKLTIYLCMLSYAITFLLSYYFGQNRLFEHPLLTPYILKIIYVLNFACSIIFEFGLITTLSKNNDDNIELLIQTNHNLENKETLLEAEIDEKSRLNNNLSKALEEKDILLSEIHHRVKNNLAVISGLIELQSIYVKDEKASAILKESRNRIKSIAVLHEKFYESKDLENIGIRPYIDELIYFINLSFNSQSINIRIHPQVDNIYLSMVSALPFSLLLNELITNSYKHAFNGRESGNIYLTCIKHQDNLILKYRDDGNGFDRLQMDKADSLGMNLIEAFCKQLKGKYYFENNDKSGIEFRLEFKYQ